MGEEPAGWQPMSREEFAELEGGQLLYDRRRRAWTVTAEPFQQQGEAYVVVRSGDLVRQIAECYADDYTLMPA